jgi:NADH-quinone oxidoreductase subunit D
MTEKPDLPMAEQLTSDEYLLNMGPQHPSTHGVLRVVLTMDGEYVKDIVPHIGYIHRGLEKLFERRRYDQIIPFTDRIDYTSPMNANLAYVLAVEKLMGIQVTDKIDFIRVIMAELTRISNHLLWFAAYCLDTGAFTPFMYSFREREEILNMLEVACGARITFNYLKFGGFIHDLPAEFFGRLKKFLSHFEKRVDEYETLLIDNVIFMARSKGVGVIDRETAISYGMTGPSLRGSNAAIDIRRDRPYSAYPQFQFTIPVGAHGDSWDRCKVRMEEMRQSTAILRQAVEGYPTGDYKVKIPRVIQPPPGEVYSAVEGPRGEFGYYIVSDGSDKPYRIKLRVPSFSNLSALREMARGTKIADLVVVMSSLDTIMPEIDR